MILTLYFILYNLYLYLYYSIIYVMPLLNTYF
jgi:hypothetical protein